MPCTIARMTCLRPWRLVTMSVLLIVTQLSHAQSPPPLTSPPSSSPSAAPSLPDTPSPSVRPTASPSSSPVVDNAEQRSFTENGITIILTGVLPLNPDETQYFKTRTEEYIESYYNNRAKERKDSNLDRGVYDVSVSIRNVSMNPPFTGVRRLDSKCWKYLDPDSTMDMKVSSCRSFFNRRRLQEEVELRIRYDQNMSYRFEGVLNEESGTQLTNKFLIQDPFNTITRRGDYIESLKGSDAGSTLPAAAIAFQTLSKVSPPELFVSKDKMNMLTIIASAAGGGAALILGVLLLVWRRRKGNNKMKDADFRDYDPRRLGENRVLPLSDNSTLEEPRQDGVFTSQNSIQGKGYPGSIVTDDPDYMYSQSYYGGEQTVVSATDGTMGGSTLQSSRFSSGGSILGSTGAGQSLFDEQSFEAYRNQGRVRKEEILEIYAPAGKLGVVIDTPNTGAPILHRIKETCPIADKLKVGDRLIAVDDEDVRSMTAVKVSKLISQKSSNPTRKFTIMRSL